MKRALVAYTSSDDEDTGIEQQPPTKKAAIEQPRKKLPALPSSVYSHVDDPAKHQGRVRTHRHVDGLFAAYIYTAIPLADVPRLAEVLAQATRLAQPSFPGLHSECASEADLRADDQGAAELHISLSRPIYISTNQRDTLRRAIREVAAKHPPFRASFAEFAILQNDENTRAFLVAEIGAGHHNFVRITRAVDTLLTSLGHEPYYAEPRFHASFAWWVPQISAVSPGASSTSTSGPAIQHFRVLKELRTKCSDALRKAGTVDLDSISLRIGKRVDSWALTGETAGDS